MTRSVGLISPAVIPMIWKDLEKHIVLYGKRWLEIVALEDVLAGLLKEEFELWLGVDGEDLDLVMICAWVRNSKRSDYYILWLGGDNLSEYLEEGLELVEHSACIRGATEVKFEGRGGWTRKMKSFGYSPRSGLAKNVKTCWRH